jgi:hypothetical protein
MSSCQFFFMTQTVPCDGLFASRMDDVARGGAP